MQGGYEDLSAFYDLYVETAERDRFIPSPLPYFQRMWTALTAENDTVCASVSLFTRARRSPPPRC
ncbi:lipid II:glycine glycyltransferase (peptidoglycan interpeptide bridge formation enzyme) [Streptomyces sp. SLBN-8D4]